MQVSSSRTRIGAAADSLNLVLQGGDNETRPGDAKTPQYEHKMPCPRLPAKMLQRSRGHEFHYSGKRMDTEAIEANGTCVMVGRKLGPV